MLLSNGAQHASVQHLSMARSTKVGTDVLSCSCKRPKIMVCITPSLPLAPTVVEDGVLVSWHEAHGEGHLTTCPTQTPSSVLEARVEHPTFPQKWLQHPML